jgi:hypothetical protein
MIIQVSPNRWSCVPSAFATATNIPLASLIETIGHDGSEVIYPDLGEPYRRRAFLLDEVAVALLEHGWIVAKYETKPAFAVDQDHIYYHDYTRDKLELISKLMTCSIGVVAGILRTDKREINHAAAWDGKECFDPLGFIYPLERYEIDFYCALFRAEQMK